MLTFALLFAALPQPPAPPEPTAEEAAKLAAREIVVRTDLGESGGGVVGLVDVAADRTATWNALMDFDARVDAIGALKSVTSYDVTETGRGATWTLKVFGVSVEFSNRYELDRAAWTCVYALDPSKENDLQSVSGSYQLVEIPSGTRLVYRSQMESGAPVPSFVKKWLAVDSLNEQLEDIRKRAEAAAPRAPAGAP